MGNQKFIIEFLKSRFGAQIDRVEEQEISNYFQKHLFKKKELIFSYGDTYTKHYFVEKGLLRMYIIDNNGREFNILFARENQFIGDLMTPAPTNFNLEAIEATTSYSISDKDFQKLMKEFKFSEKVNTSNIIRASFVKVQKRLVSMMTKSAEENLAIFSKSNPDLLQRLPQYHIASYLGVSAEFLSRILARKIKK